MTHHSLRLHAHRYGNVRPTPQQNLDRLRAEYPKPGMTTPKRGWFNAGLMIAIGWGVIGLLIWGVWHAIAAVLR